MSQIKKIHKWIRRLQALLSEDQKADREQFEALKKTLAKLRKREAELLESLAEHPGKEERKTLTQRLKLVRRHLEKGEERLQAWRDERERE